MIEKLHGVTKKIVSIIEQIILEIFSFVMLKAGLALFSKQLQTGQTTPVLKVPMSVMYFSLVLTFALILVIQAVVLVEKVMDLKNKEVGFHFFGSGFPLLRSIWRTVRIFYGNRTAYFRWTSVNLYYGHRILRTCRKPDDKRWYLPPYRKLC